MKTVFKQPIGGDGGEAMLDVDAGFVELRLRYPVSKIVEPLKNALAPLKDKAKALIPNAPWFATAIDEGYDKGWSMLTAILTDDNAPKA